MKDIIYLKGDATKPIGDGLKIITHVCNNRGGWGKGFVKALSKKWKQPELNYRNCIKCGFNIDNVEGVITVHIPRIGCGLAGGSWDKVENIIKETLCKNNIQVYVYDL